MQDRLAALGVAPSAARRRIRLADVLHAAGRTAAAPALFLAEQPGFELAEGAWPDAVAAVRAPLVQRLKVLAADRWDRSAARGARAASPASPCSRLMSWKLGPSPRSTGVCRRPRLRQAHWSTRSRTKRGQLLDFDAAPLPAIRALAIGPAAQPRLHIVTEDRPAHDFRGQAYAGPAQANSTSRSGSGTAASSASMRLATSSASTPSRPGGMPGSPSRASGRMMSRISSFRRAGQARSASSTRRNGQLAGRAGRASRRRETPAPRSSTARRHWTDAAGREAAQVDDHRPAARQASPARPARWSGRPAPGWCRRRDWCGVKKLPSRKALRSRSLWLGMGMSGDW